jgi:hypothetical protein
MTLQVDIPDSLVRQANELAERQHVSVDQVVAAALSAQISAAPVRLSITERAKRANRQRMDEILARVPNAPPLPGDEL